jgi:hypothetical protein
MAFTMTSVLLILMTIPSIATAAAASSGAIPIRAARIATYTAPTPAQALKMIDSVLVFAAGRCQTIRYATSAAGDNTFSSEDVSCSASHQNEQFAELRVKPRFQGTSGNDRASDVVTAACHALFGRFSGVSYGKQHRYDVNDEYSTLVPRATRRYTCEISPRGSDRSAPGATTGSARGLKKH